MDSITITPWIELDMVIRLIIAAVVGGIIGYERESAEKPAGLRTLILVCVGAALFTMASVSFGLMSDPSRIAAGIVVGVGFLGAGTIIHGRGGIVGLTTAAGIWVVAAVGMAVGAGLYLVAGVTTVIVVIALRLPRLPHSHR